MILQASGQFATISKEKSPARAEHRRSTVVAFSKRLEITEEATFAPVIVAESKPAPPVHGRAPKHPEMKR